MGNANQTLGEPTVGELMQMAFDTPRYPRSDEYRAGVRAALDFRCTATPIHLPYPVGTAAADAFFAGVAEGHVIYRIRHEHSAAARWEPIR